MTFGNIPTSRREFLSRNALGIGSVALAWLMKEERVLGMPANVPKKAPTFDLKPKAAQHEPQAKAMISLFMHGGPPHIDFTEPKPLLTKFSGTNYSGDVTYSFVNSASKKLLGSPFRFRKHGQCGTELSEVLPHTAKIVDDICVVRSMHTDINGHEPSIWFMNTGRAQPGRPRSGRGSPMAWARKARTCRLTSPCPIRADIRSTAFAIGQTAGCRPSSKRP